MCEKQIVHKVFSEVVRHRNLHSIAADNVSVIFLFLFFYFCTIWDIFKKTRCITLHFCSAMDQSKRLTMFPVKHRLQHPVSGSLTVTTRAAPDHPALPAPWYQPLKVKPSADLLVFPTGLHLTIHFSLKTEHGACSMFSLETSTLRTPSCLRNPIVRAAHYICTPPHPRCANLLSVWMKRAAFFKTLPYCKKSLFHQRHCHLSFYVSFIHWISVIFSQDSGHRLLMQTFSLPGHGPGHDLE